MAEKKEKRLDFGDSIRALREARGLTHQALSDSTEQFGHRVSRQGICDIENKRNLNAKLATIRALCWALGARPKLQKDGSIILEADK